MWKTSVKFLESPGLGVSILVILCIYWLWCRRKLYILAWRLPGPFALPLIGNMALLLNGGVFKVINTLIPMLSKYKAPCRMVRLWMGPALYVLVGDAGAAYQINKIPHKPNFYNYLGGLYLKNGLVQVTDVARWKQTRRMCRPLLGLNNIKSFVPAFQSDCFLTAHEMRKYAVSGESFFPLDYTVRYTGRASFSTLFDTKVDELCNADEMLALGTYFHHMFEHFQNRILVPPFKSMWIYWLFGLRQKEVKVMEKLLGFMVKVISKFKLRFETDKSVLSGSTFIHKMMQSPEVPDDEVLTQGATLLGAAIDTTKVQNHVLLLMLALHPAIQDKLYKEITTALGDEPNQIPTYEELMELDYLDRVLKETLRRYDAAPFIAKEAREDMTVTADDGDYIIPKGTVMIIAIASIHQNPDYYENPEVFDPDRWLPDRVSQRHPHCFLSFSSGARNCVGMRYALLQMKTFVVTMLRTFEILPSEHCRTMQDIKVQMAGTLLLEPNCQIRLRLRRGRTEKI